MALMQAAIFGVLCGSLVYFRLPSNIRSDDPDDLLWHERLRSWVEQWELSFYDWRARELGRLQSRSNAVVLVGIDDETVASARRDEHPSIRVQPWPREVLGGVVDRLFSEGASLVLVDMLFPDASPSLCSALSLTTANSHSDDEAFRALLDRHPGKALLGFRWQDEREPPAIGFPKPYLMKVAEEPNMEACRGWVGKILTARRPAFLIPDGQRFDVWAGVLSEEDAKSVARQWDIGGATAVRELAPSERVYQRTPTDLLLSSSEVAVSGLDVSRLPRVYGVSHPTVALLGEKTLYGNLGATPDFDGKVRGLYHLANFISADGQSHLLPSAPLAAAMRLAGTRELRYSRGRLWIGNRYSIPMDSSGYSLLRWDAADAARDGRGSLERSVSAWRFVVNFLDRLSGSPVHYRNELDGRVAILASTAGPAVAAWNTPIGRTSEASVLGQALINFLDSVGIVRADPRFDFTATLVMALAGALWALAFGGRLRSLTGLLAYWVGVAAIAAVYLWVVRWFFVNQHLWVAAAAPLLALGITFLFTTAYVQRTERRIRDFVRFALGRSLAPEVAKKVTRNLALMRPERREVTTCFAELEGFSRAADQLSAKQVARLLNEFLSEMGRVVRRSGGQVDKYLGAGLSAFWGAPLRQHHHARKGCEAALFMKEAFAKKRSEWEQRFGHVFALRVGMDTGEGVVGDMGTDERPHYTVVGNAAGLATYLARRNREYGTTLLAGSSIVQAAQGPFVFREADRLPARGSPAPRIVFELVGRAPETAEGALAQKLYEEALKAYHARQFERARDMFLKLKTEQGDTLAAMYAWRCERCLQTPPPPNWNGVFTAEAARWFDAETG